MGLARHPHGDGLKQHDQREANGQGGAHPSADAELLEGSDPNGRQHRETQDRRNDVAGRRTRDADDVNLVEQFIRQRNLGDRASYAQDRPQRKHEKHQHCSEPEPRCPPIAPPRNGRQA